MADVYFKKAHPMKNRIVGVKELIETSGILSKIEKKDMVAIKLHVGEIANPYHVDPLLVRILVGCIRERGGDPFITDTTTYYEYKRHNALDHHRTAVMHGFGYESVSAPFIVADGLGFSAGIHLKGKGIIEDVYMAEIFAETDFVLVLSHCKGHPLTAFGGALKNVGMGCATKRSKLDQHRVVGYFFDSDKCVGCGICSDICPFHFPQIRNGKSLMDSPDCMRCPVCRDNCPEGAIMLTQITELQRAVASVSTAILEQFGQKVAFLNVATNISRFCDCLDAPGEIIAGDIGYFASTDPVAVDRAFLDAIGIDLLRNIHKIEPEVIIKEAERLGAGKDKVNLITV